MATTSRRRLTQIAWISKPKATAQPGQEHCRPDTRSAHLRGLDESYRRDYNALKTGDYQEIRNMYWKRQAAGDSPHHLFASSSQQRFSSTHYSVRMLSLSVIAIRIWDLFCRALLLSVSPPAWTPPEVRSRLRMNRAWNCGGRRMGGSRERVSRGAPVCSRTLGSCWC
jgi:hypothetical protein